MANITKENELQFVSCMHLKTQPVSMCCTQRGDVYLLSAGDEKPLCLLKKDENKVLLFHCFFLTYFDLI